MINVIRRCVLRKLLSLFECMANESADSNCLARRLCSHCEFHTRLRSVATARAAVWTLLVEIGSFSGDHGSVKILGNSWGVLNVSRIFWLLHSDIDFRH